MDAGWQVVPSGSFTKQNVSLPTITVKEAGFVFVYLSYEDQSNNYIYFDDFKVTVTERHISDNSSTNTMELLKYPSFQNNDNFS